MSNSISVEDRQILRERAKKQLEYANSPEDDKILKKWDSLAKGKRETPTVRLLFSNFEDEVILPRLQCKGDEARKIEYKLLQTLVGRELFGDDTPIAPAFDITWDTWLYPFGSQPKRTMAAGSHAKGFHIDPIVEDLEEDIEKLLLPTHGISPVAQESFAFNSELPTEKVTKTTQCWGFLESQETTAVSPEMYGEFVYQYQDRLVKRFGLLSYGCCERVDAIWEDYLSKWKNLRKYFKGVCEAASGCLFEMAQREVGTIFGDYDRGRRYVEIARESIEEYWKP